MSYNALIRTLQEVLDNSGVGAFAIDPKQRVVFWNEEAQKLTNRLSNDVIGRPCWEVLAGTDHRGRRFCREGCQIVLRASFATRIRPLDLLSCPSGSQPFWVKVLTLVLPSPRGERATLFHILQDIDHLKQAETLALQIIGAVNRAPQLLAELAASPPLVPVQAAPHAIAEPVRQPGRTNLAPDTAVKDLTSREQEVFRLLAQGADTATIAKELVISQATVRNHVQRILAKLGVHSRLEAAIAAYTIHGF